MQTFTIDDVRSWEPCYDPALFLPEDWQGTALDILAVEDCPAIDRLWVAIREECVDARTLRLFAVWCVRQALALIDDPDQRSVAAIDTLKNLDLTIQDGARIIQCYNGLANPNDSWFTRCHAIV